MGYLALETENCHKETLALSRDMYDETYGPLTDTSTAEAGDALLSQLRPRLSVLMERWNRVHEAEHAMQQAPSQNKLLFQMESDAAAYGALFALHFEASRTLGVELRSDICEIRNRLEGLLQVQSALWGKISGISARVHKSVVFSQLQARLRRLEVNLRVIERIETSSMQVDPCRPVLAYTPIHSQARTRARARTFVHGKC
jgi:hypothetical protein